MKSMLSKGTNITENRTSCFEGLLSTDSSVSIHQRSLQLLVAEIYRAGMNLNPSFMEQIFIKEKYITT